jgi:transposase
VQYRPVSLVGCQPRQRAKEERSGVTGPAREAVDRARLAELERRVREREEENAFLVKAAAFFAKK